MSIQPVGLLVPELLAALFGFRLMPWLLSATFLACTLQRNPSRILGSAWSSHRGLSLLCLVAVLKQSKELGYVDSTACYVRNLVEICMPISVCLACKNWLPVVYGVWYGS